MYFMYKTIAERVKPFRGILLYDLNKPKHFIRIVLFGINHRFTRLKIFTPKLIYHKTAFVYVKVNITLFKIRCASLPNLCIGVQCLDSLPCTISDSFAMLIGRDKKNLQFVVIRFLVDF